jgi:hypothetical protein
MASLCRIVVAATLVVHLIVGCCAHHAHACDTRDCLSPADRAATQDGQCHESGGDHSHHGPRDCQGDKCSFLARSVSPNRAVSESRTLSFQTCFAALPDDRLPRVGFGPEQLSLASGRLLLPVPLHLANHVLLI